MRILIFTQYFTPEVGATQTRLHTFAAGLTSLGHDVHVVCEVPNHPHGVIQPDFRGVIGRRRTLDGFAVTYVWVKTTPIKTPRTRIAFYGSYTLMATAVAALLPRPDVILATSPPLPVAVAAAAAAIRHRAPWVLDVRDLWPEAAMAMGELSNPRLLALASRLEGWLYHEASAIVAVTEPFVQSISARVANRGKVSLIPNGTTRLWLEGAKLEPDRSSLGLPPDRFVWTFAGNVGVAQGLESAIEAAGLLDDRFLLVVLGDGPARGKLEERAGSIAPGRVEFRDQVEPERALPVLRASDALLVSLGPHPSLEKFVPSKLFDFCAVGRPVIVAAAGEPTRLVTEELAAKPVAPGDPRALARAVRELRADPRLRNRLSASGRAFAARYQRTRGVSRLEQLLVDVAAHGGRSVVSRPGQA